jgi:hypothetical protein
MDPGEIEWGGVDLIGLTRDRDKWRVPVNGVMNFRLPWNAGKVSSGYTTVGLSRGPYLCSQLQSEMTNLVYKYFEHL